MNSREQGEAFIERLNALVRRGADGKGELDVDRLREIVRENPELAIAAAHGYAGTAGQFRPHAQWALALAVAYNLEFEDDSLQRTVDRTLAAHGLGDMRLTLKNMPEGQRREPPEVVILSVDARALRECDVYSARRLLAVGPERPDDTPASTLRGRVVLGLPLDNDPREVWQIPEARAFIAKLFGEIPYLPYYLHAEPRFGMGRVLYACLAAPEAFDGDGNLRLDHPSVIEAALRSLVAVIKTAEYFPDSVDAAVTQLAALFPEGYIASLLDELKQEP